MNEKTDKDIKPERSRLTFDEAVEMCFDHLDEVGGGKVMRYSDEVDDSKD